MRDIKFEQDNEFPTGQIWGDSGTSNKPEPDEKEEPENADDDAEDDEFDDDDDDDDGVEDETKDED